MRHVFTHPEEAKAKGRKARQRMVDHYSQQVVGRQLAAELKRLDAKVRSGNCSDCFKAHTYFPAPMSMTAMSYMV